MLNFLFRRLTADPQRGAELFDAVTRIARRPQWFRDAAVPDTLDGRFAVLATVISMVMLRLEREGAAGDLVSVALTERFVEIMEAEHRELGLGDPTLGKQVRKLVGSLARRAGIWRAAIAAGDWRNAARESLYQAEPAPAALDAAEAATRELWSNLDARTLGEIQEGRIG